MAYFDRYTSGLRDYLDTMVKDFDNYLRSVFESYGYSFDELMKLYDEERLTGMAHTNHQTFDRTVIYRIDGIDLFKATTYTRWIDTDFTAKVEYKIEYFVKPEEWKERNETFN